MILTLKKYKTKIIKKMDEVFKEKKVDEASDKMLKLTIERNVFAIEAMKVFMAHQGTKVITPFNRLLIWLGRNGWKQELKYDFNDIAKKSYEMADAMCKAESDGCS